MFVGVHFPAKGGRARLHSGKAKRMSAPPAGQNGSATPVANGGPGRPASHAGPGLDSRNDIYGKITVSELHRYYAVYL